MDNAGPSQYRTRVPLHKIAKNVSTCDFLAWIETHVKRNSDAERTLENIKRNLQNLGTKEQTEKNKKVDIERDEFSLTHIVEGPNSTNKADTHYTRSKYSETVTLTEMMQDSIDLVCKTCLRQYFEGTDISKLLNLHNLEGFAAWKACFSEQVEQTLNETGLDIEQIRISVEKQNLQGALKTLSETENLTLLEQTIHESVKNLLEKHLRKREKKTDRKTLTEQRIAFAQNILGLTAELEEKYAVTGEKNSLFYPANTSTPYINWQHGLLEDLTVRMGSRSALLRGPEILLKALKETKAFANYTAQACSELTGLLDSNYSREACENCGARNGGDSIEKLTTKEAETAFVLWKENSRICFKEACTIARDIENTTAKVQL